MNESPQTRRVYQKMLTNLFKCVPMILNQQSLFMTQGAIGKAKYRLESTIIAGGVLIGITQSFHHAFCRVCLFPRRMLRVYRL